MKKLLLFAIAAFVLVQPTNAEFYNLKQAFSKSIQVQLPPREAPRLSKEKNEQIDKVDREEFILLAAREIIEQRQKDDKTVKFLDEQFGTKDYDIILLNRKYSEEKAMWYRQNEIKAEEQIERYQAAVEAQKSRNAMEISKAMNALKESTIQKDFDPFVNLIYGDYIKEKKDIIIAIFNNQKLATQQILKSYSKDENGAINLIFENDNNPQTITKEQVDSALFKYGINKPGK